MKNKVFEITGFDRRYYNIKISCKWPLRGSSTCVEITDDDTMEIMLNLTDKVLIVEVYVEKLDLDYGIVSQSHYAHFTTIFTRMLGSNVDPSFVQCTPGFETVAPIRGSQFLHRQ